MDYIQEVYDVYGDDLPAKHIYSATKASPVRLVYIMKKYKTWAKFQLAYNAFAISKRNAKAAEVVKKKPEIKKKEVKGAK